MNLKERRAQSIGKFRGRKQNGKVLKINYNAQITKLKIGIKQSSHIAYHMLSFINALVVGQAD